MHVTAIRLDGMSQGGPREGITADNRGRATQRPVASACEPEGGHVLTLDYQVFSAVRVDEPRGYVHWQALSAKRGFAVARADSRLCFPRVWRSTRARASPRPDGPSNGRLRASWPIGGTCRTRRPRPARRLESHHCTLLGSVGVAHLDKETTPQTYREFGLPTAAKSDSQDICFVPTGRYTQIIERLRPGAAEPGDIVHVDGNVLGRHGGIINYTIGRSAGLAWRRLSRSMWSNSMPSAAKWWSARASGCARAISACAT